MERTLTKKEFIKEWSGDVWRDNQLVAWLDYEDLEPGDEITLDGVDDPGWYAIDYICNQNIDLTKIL